MISYQSLSFWLILLGPDSASTDEANCLFSSKGWGSSYGSISRMIINVSKEEIKTLEKLNIISQKKIFRSGMII
jgi:hypothetical protein